MPDNPYDGPTLRGVIDCTETLTGCPIERAYVDKGYRGHDAQNPRRVFISGQKRGEGRAGDAANVLSAVGHNFRRILAWLRDFLCLILTRLWRTFVWPIPLNSAS
jgi:transposase, IS5 family